MEFVALFLAILLLLMVFRDWVMGALVIAGAVLMCAVVAVIWATLSLASVLLGD